MRFIFYDTETTGVSSDNDRIIELAAYDADRKLSFVKLIHPGIPIPTEATAIHKISDDMVREAPGFRAVAQEFIQFCEGDCVLIAHNNDAFDQPFMKKEFARCGLAMPQWTFLDSLKWARRYRPDLPRHSLQFLREIYRIEANNAHRALDDVLVLHAVFAKMTDDLSPQTILTLMSRRRPLRTMPFGKHQGMPLRSLPQDYVKWLSGSGALDKDENAELRESLALIGVL